MSIYKKTKTLGEIHIKKINNELAKRIIIENHYSKKWNSSFGKVNLGIFKDGKILGVLVYGSLMNPNSYSTIADIQKNEVLELNRMWIDDCLGHNAESLSISLSIKWIKRFKKR